MPKCKSCKTKNASFRAGLSTFCDMDCAVSYAQSKAPAIREKKEKNDSRERLAILNQTVKYWRPRAQSAFNKFIRIRDRNLPCISCGTYGPKERHYLVSIGGYWDCGHYLSTGAAAELRFSEDNAHKQCKRCNSQLSGNAVKYRINLVKRIGEYRVSLLEEPAYHVNNYITMVTELEPDDLEERVDNLSALLDPPRWRWDDYEKVYNWYHTLNKQIEKELNA